MWNYTEFFIEDRTVVVPKHPFIIIAKNNYPNETILGLLMLGDDKDWKVCCKPYKQKHEQEVMK